MKFIAVLLLLTSMVSNVYAAIAPNVLVNQVSTDILGKVKNLDLNKDGKKKLNSLIEDNVMPHVAFERMTASAIGPEWKNATDKQKKELTDLFKVLLIKTYAGALSESKDKEITLKPFRGGLDDIVAIVKTEISGGGNVVQLDYKLELDKTKDVWKVININIMGIWLVDTYRSQFKNEINKGGLDGLIETLQNKVG